MLLSRNFNTTLVSVQAKLQAHKAKIESYFNTTLVSVQAFRLFILSRYFSISIQPLYRFKTALGIRQAPCYNFNTTLVSVQVAGFGGVGKDTGFQYNPCIGSSTRQKCYLLHFGLISIQPLYRFKPRGICFNAPFDKISIQPLYRFKTKQFKIPVDTEAFQYNPCIGSS